MSWAVLLASGGYLAKLHDLAALDRMSTRAAPAIGSFIPADNPDRKRLDRGVQEYLTVPYQHR